jgi:glucose/arabinose dehydrogenase
MRKQSPPRFLVIAAAFAALLLGTSAIAHASLPGFRYELVAPTAGFATSMTLDPDGVLYYALRSGEVYRLDGIDSTLIATIDTSDEGNEALLGLAWRRPDQLIAHWVASDSSADIVGTVQISTGEVAEIARLVCDNGRPCGSEHHGGDIIVTPDGTSFFAIGDYGGFLPSQDPDSPGGKLFRVSADDEVSVYALGFRNPFDMVWHEELGIILADNGAIGEDEVNIIREGGNYGWPYTMGNLPPVEGMEPPVYTWPMTTAPTGMTLLNGKGGMPGGGMLVGAWMTRAIYWFPELRAEGPWDHPLAVLDGVTPPILDVIQYPDGEILFNTPTAIFRLVPPRRGDANGDGVIDDADAAAIRQRLMEEGSCSVLRAHEGKTPLTIGADVNGDGVIDENDLTALAILRQGRLRGVRR